MPRLTSLLIALNCALLAPAWSITLRDDVSDSTAQALANQSLYDSVGMFTRTTGGSNDQTSGVLINAGYVLTAGHIIAGSPASDFTFTIGGNVYAVAQYFSSGTDDLAIFQLAAPVLNVTPALLYTGTAEFGKTATLVGFGLGGNGSAGSSGSTGTKRAATNLIDFASGVQLAYDFDSGSGADNQLGLTSQTANEGMIALGDSGGGLFANITGQDYLIGIHSGVNQGGDAAINYSYAEIGVDLRVSANSVQSFVASVVPEPASALYVASGLGVLLAWRRRR